MAGGPIYPIASPSVIGAAGRLFPWVHIGGGNSRELPGMGAMASMSADSICYLAFRMPATLPSGTCKLVLLAQSLATTGDAKINPSWASVAVTENPDTITLNAEGVTTITWAAATTFIETKITLDADTPVGGEIIYIALLFATASWTLAQVSTWNFYILFE